MALKLMNEEPIDDENQEKFSDDPQEQLRIENELLRLKLQAETGAELNSFSEEIPPEIENAFLNNIIAFERQLDHVEEITVFEMLGTPQDIRPAARMSDTEISVALEDLLLLMEQNGVEVTFEGEYNDRLKYTFITEELFQKTTHKFDIEGMVNHFVYEEFHPNYELEAEQLIYRFFDAWAERNAAEMKQYFAEDWIAEHSGADAEEAIRRIGHLFEAYLSFSNQVATIDKIAIVGEPGEEAIVSGNICYDAQLETFDVTRVEGDFVISLKRIERNWKINSIDMPGFMLK